MKGSESTAAATERRATQRVRASSLIYVELDDGNGGIATWISESGLALTAAGVLQGRETGDELPKMQLPETKAPKKRGSRFSFADVASSRVGAEEEAQAGDFLGAAEEAEAPPSPSMKSHTFVDARKAVASAFESTAFTEERRAEGSSDRGETRTPPPPEEARRARPRLS